jgi:hypothetical protein
VVKAETQIHWTKFPRWRKPERSQLVTDRRKLIFDAQLGRLLVFLF